MFPLRAVKCQVHLCRIRYISISKQSRACSGSSYKSFLIWVCSVCKSVKRHLYEINGKRLACFSLSIGLHLLTICLLGNCSAFLPSVDFFKILKKILSGIPSVSNSLDPDQALQKVGPDLGPSCLQSLSTDNTSW